MPISTLSSLIPVPATVVSGAGRFPVADWKAYFVDPALESVAGELLHTAEFFMLPVRRSGSREGAQVHLQRDPMLTSEAWSLTVSPEEIILTASDDAGAFYAVNALSQMLLTAFAGGCRDVALDCGTIQDRPRFRWRGFLLDSSRHFQSKERVLAMIRTLARFRINVLHLHLTDSQGWRIASEIVPEIVGRGTMTDGAYSLEELREIAACAKANHVTIVPELDLPGHSTALLNAHPELRCPNGKSPREWCIGSPEARAFAKKLLGELFQIFPASPYIHIGGDEADMDNWESCSICQKAMHDKKLANLRELERDFMVEMIRFVLQNGRTPIIWGTCNGLTYPKETIIQAWLDLREPLRIAPAGNKVIYSVHTSLYFDYPATPAEPHESWMFALPEDGVYECDPFVIWPEQLKDTIIGAEACLWTEMVPQWRVEAKTLPRLYAASECAWSEPARKDWFDFRRRRELLQAAGYEEFLRSCK